MQDGHRSTPSEGGAAPSSPRDWCLPGLHKLAGELGACLFPEPLARDPPSHRAMAGDTSLAEHYAFCGMHHLFDRHTDASKYEPDTVVALVSWGWLDVS